MNSISFQTILDRPENIKAKANLAVYNKECIDIRLLVLLQSEQQAKLWDAMEGQISDGAWENSANTDWLRHESLVLIVSELQAPQFIVRYRYDIGKKNYFMYKELREIIGADVTANCGFKSEKEMVKAWNTIATAIRAAGDKEDMPGNVLVDTIFNCLDAQHQESETKIKEEIANNLKEWDKEKVRIVERLREVGYKLDLGKDESETLRGTIVYIPVVLSPEHKIRVALFVKGLRDDKITIEVNDYMQSFSATYKEVEFKDVSERILRLLETATGDYPC